MHAELVRPPLLPDVLTVKEYASRIRVHPVTVYKWILADRLRGVTRHGKLIRIDPAKARLKHANHR